MDSRVGAEYLVETAYPLEAAAEAMAGEQSSGTFVRLPSETDALRETHAARVEAIREIECVRAPSLPNAGAPRGDSGSPVYRRAIVSLSWPVANTGPSLPNLLATLAGNLFELKYFSGLRLLDVEFPEEFAKSFPGPQFGISGTRRLTGITERPLIGTIVKPSVGLSPDQTAELVRVLCEAGIDFIKDDELQANGPRCPFDARLRAVMDTIKEHADRTGKLVMYAFNVTDEADDMLRHHDAVVAAGGSCVMVSLNSCGLTGFGHLRRHSALPIHAHRNGWGYLSRAPALGFDYIAWQKFWRAAGADHMHVNGLDNKFCEPNDSVIASARACVKPMFSRLGKGFEVMPVFSSGQWAGQTVETFRAFGSNDLIYACGGGIMAHPDGVAAGVASVRQGWEAAQAGKSLEEYAADHPELRLALARYGA